MRDNPTKAGLEQKSLPVARHGMGEWLAPVAAFLTLAALVLASIWIVLGSRI